MNDSDVVVVVIIDNGIRLMYEDNNDETATRIDDNIKEIRRRSANTTP